MDMMHGSSRYQDFVSEYGDDLMGFVILLDGNTELSHRAISFLSCVKHPGSRVMDASMREFAPVVALWHFLFRPESLYLHIALDQSSKSAFMDDFITTMKKLKQTKYSWILDHITLKKSHISMKGYDSWNVLVKCSTQSPSAFSGFYENDLMVWLDQHHQVSEGIIEIAKSLMVGFTHRLVYA